MLNTPIPPSSPSPVDADQLVGILVSPAWVAIDRAVADLGFELVDLEQSQAGLLRVFIDIPDGSRFITVEDCELTSRQLVHQLPVEGIDFARLEISSPGVDRRLSRAVHFQRFMGERIKIKLRRPLMGRRQFEGHLAPVGFGDDAPADQPASDTPVDQYRLVLTLESAIKAKAKAVAKAKAKAARDKSNAKATADADPDEADGRAAVPSPTPSQPEPEDTSFQVLDFQLQDLESARLVPDLPFKEKKR